MYTDHNVHVGVKDFKVWAQFHTVPVGGGHSMGSQSQELRVRYDVIVSVFNTTIQEQQRSVTWLLGSRRGALCPIACTQTLHMHRGALTHMHAPPQSCSSEAFVHFQLPALWSALRQALILRGCGSQAPQSPSKLQEILPSCGRGEKRNTVQMFRSWKCPPMPCRNPLLTWDPPPPRGARAFPGSSLTCDAGAAWATPNCLSGINV